MTVPLIHLSFFHALLLSAITLALTGADQTKTLPPGLYGPSDGKVRLAMSCRRSADCLASSCALNANQPL